MFKTAYQGSFFSIFRAVGGKPMENWSQQVKNGCIERIMDDVIKSTAWKIKGKILSTTFMTCPADDQLTLGIQLPILVLLVKNLDLPFSFELQVLDDTNFPRRFILSTSCSSTDLTPLHCSMPLKLDDGWNKLMINLSELTRRAYGFNYTNALRVQINANCCISCVYFCDRLYSDDDTPSEYKLHQHKTREQKLQMEAAGPSWR